MSVLHAAWRQQVVTIREPGITTRDGVDRPSPGVVVGTPTCSVRDITSAFQFRKPGTKTTLALRLYTEDRTTPYQAGQHATVIYNGATYHLLVSQIVTYSRHRQIDVVDHEDAS